MNGYEQTTVSRRRYRPPLPGLLSRRRGGRRVFYTSPPARSVRSITVCRACLRPAPSSATFTATALVTSSAMPCRSTRCPLHRRHRHPRTGMPSRRVCRRVLRGCRLPQRRAMGNHVGSEQLGKHPVLAGGYIEREQRLWLVGLRVYAFRCLCRRTRFRRLSPCGHEPDYMDTLLESPIGHHSPELASHSHGGAAAMLCRCWDRSTRRIISLSAWVLYRLRK